MNGPTRPAQRQRRVTRRVYAFAALGIVLCVYTMLVVIGMGKGITEENGKRVKVGWSRADVEAILGKPNPLPELARKREAVWDSNAMLGLRYVSIHVAYNTDGTVSNTQVKGFWRKPTWAFW